MKDKDERTFVTQPLIPASWTVLVPKASLVGRLVRLEPLSLAHIPALLNAGQDEQVWSYATSKADTPEAMKLYVDGILQEYEAGTTLPFAVVLCATDAVVGITRLKNISLTHRSALVGSWYSPTVWRSGANIEAKLLLLTHAFEVMGCIRVEFHTDALNVRSRASLTRLGATQEGLLRSCQLTLDGQRRDTVILSVLDTEWAAVRERLSARLVHGTWNDTGVSDATMSDVLGTPRVGVGVLIVNEASEVLLTLRIRPPEAGCWSIVGGKVEFMETLEAAAVREALEETGLHVELLHQLCVTDHRVLAEGQHWVSPAYLARVVKGQLFNPEPEKTIAVQFFALDALPYPLTVTARAALAAFRSEEHG